ncbi:hypothetical protein F3X75_02065 [Salmonella enterica subsp. enterica]|nr:hypothetical protein [Salmonella enterica subsp. enterica serovar Oranienburg]
MAGKKSVPVFRGWRRRFAIFATFIQTPVSRRPFSDNSEWWKPSSPRRDLVKAGALILAEIERGDRAFATDICEGK